MRYSTIYPREHHAYATVYRSGHEASTKQTRYLRARALLYAGLCYTLSASAWRAAAGVTRMRQPSTGRLLSYHTHMCFKNVIFFKCPRIRRFFFRFSCNMMRFGLIAGSCCNLFFFLLFVRSYFSDCVRHTRNTLRTTQFVRQAISLYLHERM